MRIPTQVKELLDTLPCEWEIVAGRRHEKIFVNGRLAGILTRGSGSGGQRRYNNVCAQIKRAAEQRGEYR